ncbi:hypothetical protein LCGC14_3080640, partial [marine sediment metagenome]
RGGEKSRHVSTATTTRERPILFSEEEDEAA